METHLSDCKGYRVPLSFIPFLTEVAKLDETPLLIFFGTVRLSDFFNSKRSPFKFFDELQQTGVSKSPKRLPFYIFRHYETVSKSLVLRLFQKASSILVEHYNGMNNWIYVREIKPSFVMNSNTFDCFWPGRMLFVRLISHQHLVFSFQKDCYSDLSFLQDHTKISISSARWIRSKLQNDSSLLF